MGREKIVEYANNRYKGSLSDDVCDILEGLLTQAGSEDGSCTTTVSDFTHIIYNLDDSDVTTYIEDMEEFGMPMHSFEKKWGELRDYQTVGACFLYLAKRCILGDSVGMGKTVEVAGALNWANMELEKLGKDKVKFLVLTEKNLAHQFRKEMVKFTGDYVQLIENGEQKTIERFRNMNPYECELDYSIVGTHALLTTKGFIQWLEQCRTMGKGFPFDTLIVDESSFLGGTGTQVVNSFKAISKYFNRIYFLNATPFETNLMTFYNQLNLLDPKLLPTKTNFTKEYCLMDYRGMYPRPTGKYKNQGEFKRLIAYRYLARTRKMNGAEMTDSDGRVILSPLSKIQKEWLNKSLMHRIVFDCPSHLDPSIEFNSENVPKLGSLNELLNNECADADTIIIFVYYKEAQKHLSKYLTSKGISNRILNGDTDANERQTIIDGFKMGAFKVLLTNVQKGLNFKNCNHCIFYSFDPNPSRMVQFEGRITRDFDIEGKHVYILCSQGEEYKTLNNVVRQRAKATSEFTNTDLSIIMDILLGGEN